MVLGRGGMICTSQPLASFAGAEAMRRGGNAVDAAITAAAVLGVVEPYSIGLGGDCFMLVWSAAERKLHGLNGSGRAPAAATVEALRARGLSSMPSHGMLAVTVPGAVDGWSTAIERFGRLAWADALQPAIRYAREGFPVSEIIAREWGLSAPLLQNPEAVRSFTVNGAAPCVGQIVRLPDLAAALEEIATEGAAAFYRGRIADEIIRCSSQNGGLLRHDDLEKHRSNWVDPIFTDYRGHRVYEIPPNGQGLAALLALNILEQFDFSAEPAESARSVHLRIEAVKLAYADRNRYIADPDQVEVPVAELLSKDYARDRARLIREDAALQIPVAGRLPLGSDTAYLTAADGDGNVVSLISSLFFPFGSGLVAGNTGILLHNRGFGFSLDPGHPNCIAPGKRPFHTIIPAMLFEDDRPLVSFGVMGGDMQAQAHLQVVSNLVDHGFNIQEALDRPRFHYLEGSEVACEPGLAGAIGAGLAAVGHVIQGELAALPRGGFGGGQGIMIDPESGAYWSGSDERKDGCAIGY